jgi:hypothetical protein
MTLGTSERLYNLLPSVYRVRDASQGEVLRALLGVIDNELQALETDIDDLYADWFIETCAEWVVPYIGDLLGVRGLHAGSADTFSLRAYVANTLAYRRRKGTATMLEQLARDVTGWDARVVEFFELLGTTQHLNHLRPQNLRTPDLRDAAALELVDTAFDTAAHTADVRHINDMAHIERRGQSLQGRHNIPNIGIYLWRIQAYAVTRSNPRQQGAGFYSFDPLGLDQTLFNQPRTETRITQLAEEINVTDRLRRRPLYDELESLRQSLVDGSSSRLRYFDPKRPVLRVFLDGSPDPLASERILICDLSDWQHPSSSKDYTAPDGSTVSLPIDVAVDPALGRLAFPAGETHDPVHVSYAYGSSADVAAGPYNRSQYVADSLKGSVDWQAGVSQEIPPLPGQIFATLGEAVQAWNAQPPGSVGLITVMDSRSYTENLTGASAIQIPEGSQLVIAAANWPEVLDPDSLVLTRQTGMFAADRVRPHLDGSVSVRGTAPSSSANPGGLVFDGLLLEGPLTVLAGNLGGLQVSHSSLVPAEGGLTVNPSVDPNQQNAQLAITLERTICGPLSLPVSVPDLTLVDSIIDQAGGTTAIDAPGAEADIRQSTVLGTLNLRSLDASNSIFTGLVLAERRQVGCVRYSFSPDGSQTPRRFRCQPDLALEVRAEALGLDSAADLPADERTLVVNRVKPEFTSERFGDPEYAQLILNCAREIAAGADNGAEMGVFYHLMQPQREANLQESLAEYLRFGLEAGIFFVT